MRPRRWFNGGGGWRPYTPQRLPGPATRLPVRRLRRIDIPIEDPMPPGEERWMVPRPAPRWLDWPVRPRLHRPRRMPVLHGRARLMPLWWEDWQDFFYQ